ncbi:MAG: response regulator transcription factor [Clostridia bacterium]|nr:response regulator transcription factor [Clostridia bacterium]
MLNFVICDDNLKIVERLTEMLDNIFMKNNYEASVTFTTNSADEVLDHVKFNKADVILLDINLKSNKTGLDVAEEIRNQNKDTYLIFLTGHLEFALVAYKYKTFDYIAKPITQERLEMTINRLFDDIYSKPKKYIKLDNKNTIIDEAEVNYIKRDGMKLVFNTNCRDYEIYSSFNKVQDKLPENFVRCHKSYIINVDRISNVEPTRHRVFFNDNNFCDIGPKYKNAFMEVMNKHGFFK